MAAGTFTVLTYNINDDTLSESAPPGWSLQQQHESLKQLILQEKPDVLCLQECFPGIPNLISSKYTVHGSAGSHRGACILATRNGGPLIATDSGITVGPCVVVPLLHEGTSQQLCVASAHLAPFAESNKKRAAQIGAIVASVPAVVPLVFAGDANMRETETAGIAEHGLKDAWVEAGSPADTRYTWDTRVNRYYTDGHRYTARYDRILYRGCQVRDLSVIANKPCSPNPEHFLSDHFGLTATVELEA